MRATQQTTSTLPVLNLLMAASLGLFVLAGAIGPAQAKGCMTGAAVGGVAGHVAGHHAVLGAAAGCAVGHHEAAKHDQQAQTSH
jgi:hypothetical protein